VRCGRWVGATGAGCCDVNVVDPASSTGVSGSTSAMSNDRMRYTDTETVGEGILG